MATIEESSLAMEVRVTNRSGAGMADLGVAHCVQLSTAPDFACDDFSRIYVRTDGRWASLAELKPSSDYPHYFHEGLLEAGRNGRWRGHMSPMFESVEVDHPLMVCVSRDGTRAVGTAAQDYDHVFHNRANRHLLCIHSTQRPLDLLGPGETAVFRQMVYFVDGGLEGCVAAFEADAGSLGYG